jgi:hypothetical protein
MAERRLVRDDVDGPFAERLRTFLLQSVAVPMPPTLTERILELASRPAGGPGRSSKPPGLRSAAATVSLFPRRAGRAAGVLGDGPARPLPGLAERPARSLVIRDEPLWNRRRTLAEKLTRGIDELDRGG